MLKVMFTIDETGEELVVDAEGLASVMQVAVENDVPGIEGECGGEMSCGTCHVYVEQIPDGYASDKTDDEIDMLEVVSEPTDASRLSCQLKVDASIGGLAVRVPTA